MINWIIANWADIVQGYLCVVGLASIIIKLTPTVKDDLWLKKVLQFVGKFVALNRK